jgi:transcriptional regulator with XRE-family HTH domain
MFSMPRIFADCKDEGKRELCSPHEDFLAAVLQTAGMTDDKNGGPNNLRAWREFMRMTQEELAGACDPPTTGSVISLLEEGDRGLSLKWLRRLAPALKTRPGFIVEYDPHEADTRTLEMISRLEPAQRAQVDKIIETFLKDGTNN